MYVRSDKCLLNYYIIVDVTPPDTQPLKMLSGEMQIYKTFTLFSPASHRGLSEINIIYYY